MSYDRFLTIFSPEGRLYQIEYATQAVKRSNATLLSLATADSTVLVAQKTLDQPVLDNKLLYKDNHSITRFFKISPAIIAALVGPIADCKALVVKARQEASSYKYKHGFSMPVDELAFRLGDLAQLNTQHAGRRTLAVECILTGVSDPGADAAFLDQAAPNVVYKVEPSGHVLGYKGVSSGKLGQEVNGILERKFLGQNLSEDEAIKLGIMSLQEAARVDFKPEAIEVATVNVKTGELRRLTDAEVETKLNEIIERDD